MRVDSSGMTRKVTVWYRGVPIRQWCGTAASRTCEPVTCSTKR